MSLQGAQKLAILLCKFSDSAETEPNPKSFYEDLFVNRGTGGLNDYWIAASLGAINLDGSQVFGSDDGKGWKTFNVNHDDFIAAHPGRADKIKGAIDQFTNLDTSKFTSVVALFNVMVGDGGSNGPGSRVLAQPADANVTFLAHETGHVFGLEHSFDHSTRLAEQLRAPTLRGVFRPPGHYECECASTPTTATGSPLAARCSMCQTLTAWAGYPLPACGSP